MADLTSAHIFQVTAAKYNLGFKKNFWIMKVKVKVKAIRLLLFFIAINFCESRRIKAFVIFKLWRDVGDTFFYKYSAFLGQPQYAYDFSKLSLILCLDMLEIIKSVVMVIT